MDRESEERKPDEMSELRALVKRLEERVWYLECQAAREVERRVRERLDRAARDANDSRGGQ